MKITTLKKHMNIRHTKQKCKICNKEFITSMELIHHVAKENHNKDEPNDGESEKNSETTEVRKNYIFVFGESV